MTKTTATVMAITTTYDFVGSHREEVGHQRRESRSKAALSDETKLQFRQTHSIIAALPVPARNVQQIRLQTVPFLSINVYK